MRAARFVARGDSLRQVFVSVACYANSEGRSSAAFERTADPSAGGGDRCRVEERADAFGDDVDRDLCRFQARDGSISRRATARRITCGQKPPAATVLMYLTNVDRLAAVRNGTDEDPDDRESGRRLCHRG